jgi:hypothetical protein
MARLVERDEVPTVADQHDAVWLDLAVARCALAIHVLERDAFVVAARHGQGRQRVERDRRA